jgi:hypothetical protein
MDPALIVDGLPFVSLLREIEANSLSASAVQIRRQYRRIPYSSPLYWWETHTTDGVVTYVYIGQTVRLRIQKRFEAHAADTRAKKTALANPFTWCEAVGGDSLGE